jgi:hypothetical protein
MWLRIDALGGQPIDNTRTSAAHTPGFRVRAQDATYGDAEFVYVLASIAISQGQLVTYNRSTGATALATTRSKGLCGVASGTAIPSGAYGWLQVVGTAPTLTSGTLTSGSNVYTTATPGTVSSTYVAGDQVFGATTASANGTPAAGMTLLSLNQPYLGDTDNA